MPHRIGVIASHAVRPGVLRPSWIYGAAAYDSEDQFREPVWTCSHEHDDPQAAQACGVDWLKCQDFPGVTA